MKFKKSSSLKLLDQLELDFARTDDRRKVMTIKAHMFLSVRWAKKKLEAQVSLYHSPHIQTLVESSVGDHLPKLCPAVPTSNQHGRCY
jgi:hypothetical protein